MAEEKLVVGQLLGSLMAGLLMTFGVVVVFKRLVDLNCLQEFNAL